MRIEFFHVIQILYFQWKKGEKGEIFENRGKKGNFSRKGETQKKRGKTVHLAIYIRTFFLLSKPKIVYLRPLLSFLPFPKFWKQNCTYFVGFGELFLLRRMQRCNTFLGLRDLTFSCIAWWLNLKGQVLASREYTFVLVLFSLVMLQVITEGSITVYDSSGNRKGV